MYECRKLIIISVINMCIVYEFENFAFHFKHIQRHFTLSLRLNQFITITHCNKNVCVIFTKDFSLIIGIIVYPLARSVWSQQRAPLPRICTPCERTQTKQHTTQIDQYNESYQVPTKHHARSQTLTLLVKSINEN